MYSYCGIRRKYGDHGVFVYDVPDTKAVGDCEAPQAGAYSVDSDRIADRSQSEFVGQALRNCRRPGSCVERERVSFAVDCDRNGQVGSFSTAFDDDGPNRQRQPYVAFGTNDLRSRGVAQPVQDSGHLQVLGESGDIHRSRQVAQKAVEIVRRRRVFLIEPHRFAAEKHHVRNIRETHVYQQGAHQRVECAQRLSGAVERAVQ